jgi:hypothetical protein
LLNGFAGDLCISTGICVPTRYGAKLGAQYVDLLHTVGHLPLGATKTYDHTMVLSLREPLPIIKIKPKT